MGGIIRSSSLILLSLLLSFSCFSQDNERDRDTLAMLTRFEAQAERALAQQKFSEAIQNLKEANKLVTEYPDISAKADVITILAKLHFTIENYEKANTEIDHAIAFLKNTDDRQKLAEAYTFKGLINTELHRFEEAEKFLKDADAIFSELNDEKNQALVLFGLGLWELEQKNPKSAINYFNATIPTLEQTNQSYYLVYALLEEANAYLLLPPTEVENAVEKAEISLDKATPILESNKFSRLRMEALRIGSKVALRKGNVELASAQIDDYYAKRDSLTIIYSSAISESADAESSIGNLNEIIASQQDDLDKKQRSIKFTQMTTGLSIALIVILSLLTLSLFKNNNLRAKANDLLKDKNNELLLAKEKAEKASLAKAQFLSTITHELRTPLYAVTGLTHLLLEENPKEHQKEHLNSLKFSGEYLLSLINNILDLNKLEANKVEVEKTSFSLRKRINDVLVALGKSAKDKSNTLHLEYDEDIPSKLVGDPLKLSQILINLIGNSVKFTENGDIWVRIQKKSEKNDNVTLHFEVEDNGVGISKKKQKSIFETFSQGSLQIHRKFGGTGLGLAIVKNLLELMNSKIYLESQLGKGSKFHFDLTLSVSEEVKDDSNPKNIIYDVDYVALENRSVLVVEDNKINQMITKKILEKNKMKCEVADNGMDAVKLVQQNQYDVILMDIHMPGISGVEATQKIREFNKHIPIIALTAVTIDENLDDFYRAGFNEIIPKPFKPEEFFEKIYRTLEQQKFPVNS
ncbi:response regulator [Luteirhabdus pelagi]|uniref:response regulator n=1 Tax=Luteirhabdus pelagi TaxID=2792783 RepID=UPI001F4659E4|nr:response regulator [Luteirhabdus pelagi]